MTHITVGMSPVALQLISRPASALEADIAAIQTGATLTGSTAHRPLMLLFSLS